MADSNRPYRGAASGEQSASGDPLADLARLIGGQNDPFSAPARSGRQDARAWQPDPYGHPDPRIAAAQSDYPEPFPSSAEPAHGHAAYDGSYGGAREPAPAQYGAPPQFSPPPYQQGQGYPDPFYREHDEHDGYDEQPARRRGGMLTVMAVIALALIGTAVAFGYRAVFGPSGSSTPPVIKADTTPAKIVPAATNDQSKQIYDRVGERPAAERVVSREEKPVDINDTLKNPRVVGTSPAPVANPAGLAAPAGLPANASALQSPSAAAAAAGPKRVRTVTIKSDGADGESQVATAARTATMQSAQPQPTIARVASATSQESEPPAPVPTRTVSTRAPVQHAAPPPNPNAPLSLAPPSAGGSARAPARTAAVAPAAAPAPVRTATATGGGNYTVQVSSQRSEAEAQSAFRSLQSKYPDQLAGQQPIIRRADLGDKGVFYRVQVGPFDSSDQASELCGSLKSAGGSCVVQRN